MSDFDIPKPDPNLWALRCLYLLDVTIRFMGILGGFILAFAGILLGWWNNDTGAFIYVIFFGIAIFYSMEYNGREWTQWPKKKQS